MQRKSTKSKPPSQKLRARALAIINSDKYDGDTRASIAFQLKTNYSGLADMVRDAEQGVTICDTEMAKAKQREGIRQAVKILNSGPGIFPLWFLEAINSALMAVAKEKGVDATFVNLSEHGLWLGMNPSAGKLITELFQAAPSILERKLTFALLLTEQERVTEAVNEILTNPRTPEDLYGHVADFIVETVNERGEGNSLIYSKAMLPIIIAAHPEDELHGATLAKQAARDKEAQS